MLRGRGALPRVVMERCIVGRSPSVRVHDRAQHDPALVRPVVAGAAVHRRALVPYEDIADAPAVVVDEARSWVAWSASSSISGQASSRFMPMKPCVCMGLTKRIDRPVTGCRMTAGHCTS